MLGAAAGAYLHLNHVSSWLEGGGWFGFVGTLGCFFSLVFVVPHESNYNPEHDLKQPVGYASRSMLRRNLFLGFSFFYGLGLGPLIETVLRLSPSILPVALVTTSLVFVSFSLSALYTRRRSYLFLGGIVSSALSVLLFLSILYYFFQSRLLFNIHLYGGLVIFCLYVLYDTQMMVERAEAGSTDVAGHALELYMDVASIFVRLLVILTKNKKNSDEEDNKRRR